MFGAFRPSLAAQGGLLWKNPWRLSGPRKQRTRERLRNVDEVVATIARSGVSCKALDLAQALPKESEMEPRDKYTVFNRHAQGMRKSIHKIPKWTRVTQRINPRGF